MQERKKELKRSIEDWKDLKTHEMKIPSRISEKEFTAIAKAINSLFQQMSDSEIEEIEITEEDWERINEAYKLLRCKASTMG